MPLSGKRILITGAAVRVGRAMALAVAKAGGDVVVHYGHSEEEAKNLKETIDALGVDCTLVQADLSKPESAAEIIETIEQRGPLFALVNSAAIFEDLELKDTDLARWQQHLDINLTAPFMLSKAFGEATERRKAEGRIINILDWRALRPGADHLPYTISKAGLAALTKSLAAAMAPAITVNGMALGAILPPKGEENASDVLENVPAKRWAEVEEVGETLIFLLSGPSYITGEILYLDGGRHLI
ncbi:MAG: SDR family oxidoreductase [Chloroflexi bacterium]|nr:SDR family oxidoreductase [Chloroflexota bacterium]